MANNGAVGGNPYTDYGAQTLGTSTLPRIMSGGPGYHVAGVSHGSDTAIPHHAIAKRTRFQRNHGSSRGTLVNTRRHRGGRGTSGCRKSLSGPWDCATRGNHNWSFRQVCNKCAGIRPGASIGGPIRVGSKTDKPVRTKAL